MLSGAAYDHLQGKLDLPLEFAGKQRLKNLDRPLLTYRLTAYALLHPDDGRDVTDGPCLPRLLPCWRPSSPVSRSGGCGRESRRSPNDHRSPRCRSTNLGGDDATGRLADGITEDIITDLSRFRDFDVIARNSTTVYEDRPVDAHQVGKDLKVRYVLEGSIQKQDEQIRATAQLVHAATGAHVWSERWDRPARDLFAVQTEIAELVANQLGGWGVVLGASNFGHPNCGAGTADRALRLDPN
jgi:TolB-like protein